jgi:hypothetical protein
MGLLGVLTVVFVVLKLTSVIDWSWIIVLSPTILAIVLRLIIHKAIDREEKTDFGNTRSIHDERLR